MLSVVIPLLDEEGNLELLHQKLTATLISADLSYEIIFVNDGSTDRSAAILQELFERDSAVTVINFRQNFGKTAALTAGFRQSQGEVIVTLDADLQDDPAAIPDMLAKLNEGYDLVHGWRKNRQDTFVNRRLPSIIANWIISKVTGFPRWVPALMETFRST